MMRMGILAAAAVLLLVAPAAMAEQDEPLISLGTCIEKGGAVGQPEGSAIRACCLDGLAARGCYICDNQWKNCVWEPALTRQLVKSRMIKLQDGATLSVSPGTPGKTKLLTPAGKTPLPVAPAQ
jgi:hypothetical protein